MYVLGLDLETTGLDIKTNRIIEIGAVVWDTESNTAVTLSNELINISPEKLTPNIIDLTGIKDNQLQQFGVNEKLALQNLVSLAKQCVYVVAHNGNNFDKPVLTRALKRHGLSLDKPWIDTVHDIPYPGTIKTRKLSYLAAEHHYLNTMPHRAVFDVLTMLNICSHYNWSEILKTAATPTYKVIAKVSYDDRHKAKKAGFRWDKASSSWVKNIKKDVLDSADFEFEYDIIEN
ncbi:3'-5' exonuclease [Catenovulum sp. SM1970]|uniref:3'-5' exonuclease n=1 Tax=Marinifaba aquimaris TaxID=2741323 RepID=UPI001573D7FD|nr:3'-5' exonuclease [Marinifaba aquimaris]NTS77300.1 3'-5' exonuclease [Marinifaba aquimaris]